MPHADITAAKELAQSIVDLPQDQVTDMVHDLRRSHRLSSTTHTLNSLLRNEDHRGLAQHALRRLGFLCD